MSRFWWLSFVGEGEFIGVIVTEAASEAAAVQKVWRAGINPGGEVLAGELRAEYVPGPEYRDRLLNRRVAYRIRDDINSRVAATDTGIPGP